LALAAAVLASAAPISLVPETVPPLVADRQDCQIPDRAQRGGWGGGRIHASTANRLAQMDVDRLLEGYRHRPGRQAWDGEHIGKWLHAATLAWANSGQAELRAKLDYAVTELAKCQLADGYLGTYAPAERWTAWDVWAHKYNLIGLITYLRHTGNLAPLPTCRRMADLLCQTFGDAPGQRDILLSGRHLGMASTSVLEPMVWLYRLTGEPRYLEFCHYLIRSWEKPHGPKIISTLLAAKRVDLVGNGKAYEMLSCLNGALEYYRTVNDPRILEAALNAWRDIVTKRLYLTGTASYQEFFRADYDLPNVNKVGETCVTVTWLQFNAHLLRLTGEARFAEQMERTILNQLLGAQSPDGTAWGYYVEMEGVKPYSSVLDAHCCLSSGPRGVALIPTLAVTTDADGVVVNLYDAGTANLNLRDGRPVAVTTKTLYPGDGRIRLTVSPAAQTSFTVKLRVPMWCAAPQVRVNDRRVEAAVGADGYLALRREWRAEDCVELRLKLEPRVIAGDFKNEGKAAVLYGPLVLAADVSLLGNADRALDEIGLPGVDMPSLRVKPRAARGAWITWAGARLFSVTAVARDPMDRRRQPGSFRIGLIPFADAGARGSAYQVWLPYQAIRPSRNLLLDGIETRSRRPHVRVREAGQPLAIRYAGCVNDAFQSMALTFNNQRAAQDWYAVTVRSPIRIAEVVFYHGQTAFDGGWFDASAGKPRVQVKRQPEGDWETLSELKDYPATTATDPAGLKGGDRFVCELTEPATVFGVRIIGPPACGNNPRQAWSSCLELQAFGPRQLKF